MKRRSKAAVRAGEAVTGFGIMLVMLLGTLLTIMLAGQLFF